MKLTKGASRPSSILNTIGDLFEKQNLFSDEEIAQINKYNDEFSRLQEKVKNSNINIKNATIAQKAYDNTMGDANKSLQDFVKKNNNGVIAVNGLTKASKAAELGMKALSIAGNMVLSFLISEVVTYLFTYNQRIEESIQKSKELQEEYRNFAKESADSINSLESQETEFRRLSKGVDDYGKNISLSSDEYERYKSIVSEILGATPDLISGYDEEGNAIANKNGLLERSIELLKKEQREKLKNMVSSDTTEDIADGSKKERVLFTRSFKIYPKYECFREFPYHSYGVIWYT